MSSSDSSSLSSAPPSDDESMSMTFETNAPITKYFKQETPPPKRPASPPHEYVLADNPDIAFLVMFRARFSDAFPKSLPHYGPQDIERGVQETVPGEHAERLLCALLGLVLNRKKDVEKGHYQRALEDAIGSHSSQWPRSWGGKNPLHGGHTFTTMSPEERLRLLKALALWSLSSSDAVQAKIKESYKQNRHDDDLNQPLSVQPWGRDELKRRYWLIEGQDDTHFRLYRESNPALKTNTWWSVAGTIDEAKAIAESLEKEKSQHSKRLSEKIRMAIPRFEGGEEKRRRRDYRLSRKAAFSRPEPGFSLYEGRTRGKRLKYTYSDEDDFLESDEMPSTRRSTRNVSGITTPGEPTGPVFTASGRQIRAPATGIYGESMLSGQRQDAEEANGEDDAGRPQRGTRGQANGHVKTYVDEMGDESDASSSGNEWKGDDEEEDDIEPSEDEPMLEDEGETPSLVVQLRYGKGPERSSSPLQDASPVAPTTGGPTPIAHPARSEPVPGEMGEETKITQPIVTESPAKQMPSEQAVLSSSANVGYPASLDGSEENISAPTPGQDPMKSEATNLKINAEQPAAPSSPSRVRNGSD